MSTLTPKITPIYKHSIYIYTYIYIESSMGKIFPVKLKEIWGVLDGMGPGLCESSGSEHAEELWEMVDSFLERNERVEEVEKKNIRSEEERSGTQNREMLMGLVAGDGDDGVRQTILTETEIACKSVGIESPPEEFKLQLLTCLRQRGLDAGLCKSKWLKTGHHPGGEYEYIDIMSSTGARYIVELSTISEFTIARPTNHYASLLEAFPPVLVCKEGDLKRVVTLMCAAMRESLNQRDMPIPPWRTNGYMMAKWFASYKRTTNAVPTTIAAWPLNGFSSRQMFGKVGDISAAPFRL